MADAKCPNCRSTKVDDELTSAQDGGTVCGKCGTAYSEQEASGELDLLRTKDDDAAAEVPAYDPAHDVELDPKISKLITSEAAEPERIDDPRGGGGDGGGHTLPVEPPAVS